MHINLFLIPLVIIIGFFVSLNDNRQNRLRYIIFSSIVLILVAALRSPEWMTNTYGIDTLNYKDYFENTFDMGWSEYFHSFYMRYVMGVDEFDVGFIGLNKIISLFTHEFWVYSIIADLLFFVPFGIILYRYTTSALQIMFAFVFYVALVQIFLFSGARQVFALGFDLMALLSIIDRKRLRTIFFFVIGITIHLSSILFALPLLMIWFGIKPKTMKVLHALCFVAIPLVLFLPNEVILFMGSTMGVERYAEYGKGTIQGGAEGFIFLIETVSLFCLLAIKRKDLIANPNIRIFYVMVPLFTFFSPLIRSNGTMIRISLYFHLFVCLLVPYAIDCFFNKNERNSAYVLAILALSVLTLSGGGTQYHFFWQQ